MHIYTKNLTKILIKNFKAYIYKPKVKFHKNEIFKTFKIIYFELKPLKKNLQKKFDIFISVHPRYPLNMLLGRNHINQKKGIVICDYMQCISLNNTTEIKKLIKEFKILEIFRKFYHTFFFKLTLKKADFYIFISNYTRSGINEWDKKNNNYVKPEIVIHPLPSFNFEKVYTISNKLNSKISSNKNLIKLLFITGNPSTKRNHLIIPIIKSLAEKNKNLSFYVSIVGGIKLNYISLPKNIKIDLPNKSISESSLIKKFLETNFFISTSQEEGFGIPLLDAVCFNIFCIASKIKAYEEIQKTYQNEQLYLVENHADKFSYVEVINKLLKKDISFSQKNRSEKYLANYEKIFLKTEQRMKKFLKKIY